MSKNVTATFRIGVNVVETITLGGGSGNTGETIDGSVKFANGTGANNGNDWWGKVGSVTAGAPTTVTLSALVDDIGRTCPFTKIRGWAIYNLGGGTLRIGGAATHAWTAFLVTATDKFLVPAGASIGMAIPDATALAVAAGSNDQLMIDAVSGTVNYQIVLFGED